MRFGTVFTSFLSLAALTLPAAGQYLLIAPEFANDVSRLCIQLMTMHTTLILLPVLPSLGLTLSIVRFLIAKGALYGVFTPCRRCKWTEECHDSNCGKEVRQPSYHYQDICCCASSRHKHSA